MTQRLKDRIALVTGASRGIGRAIALAFAKEGAHVIALSRKKKPLEKLDDEICALGGTASLIPLDLADGQTIDTLGPALYERFGRLDAMVGNAAILGTLSPLPHIKSSDWDKVIGINLTANWRLIRTLDPLLRKSDAARILFLTSSVARNPRAYWGPYAVSKAALENLALIYADELQSTPAKVFIIDPGGTATDMRATAFPGEDPAKLPPPERITETCIRLARVDAAEPSGSVISL